MDPLSGGQRPHHSVIVGYFDPRLPGRLAPRVSAFVWIPALIPSPQNLTRVEFLVDTGAMPTALMPVDVLRLHGAGTPEFLQKLRALPTQRSEGIGGAVVYDQAPAHVGLRHEDSSISDFEVPIQIADPQMQSTRRSILGFTVLGQVHLHIHGPSLTVILDAPIAFPASEV